MARKPIKLRTLWQRTPQTVKIIGYCGTVFGAIYAFSQAAPVAEPYLPAHHGWVRGVFSDELAPLKMAQTQQAVAIDRFLLYQLQESLNKARSDPAANTSPVVKERVKQLEEQIKDTETRVKNAK